MNKCCKSIYWNLVLKCKSSLGMSLVLEDMEEYFPQTLFQVTQFQNTGSVHNHSVGRTPWFHMSKANDKVTEVMIWGPIHSVRCQVLLLTTQTQVCTVFCTMTQFPFFQNPNCMIAGNRKYHQHGNMQLVHGCRHWCCSETLLPLPLHVCK